MAKYQVVSEDGRHAGDRSRETIVAEYDTEAEAQAHADRATKASKAAEGENWGDWGEMYFVREIPVTAREKTLAHAGVVKGHFYVESRDVVREHLIAYLKGRQARAIESGTYRAKIRTLSAFELEVLISDLEAAEPASFMGHHSRMMRRGDEGQDT